MANATSTQLQELYVAYFGRAADPTGLDYWVEKGTTQAGFAATQYAQAEFKDAYGSKSVEAQVNQIYKNLFDREADVTGLTYWTQQINLGNIQVAEIATHLIWAAQNNSGSSADKTALANRTDAAVAYTAEVKSSTANILAYQPTTTDPWVAGTNITEGVSYLSGIDGTTAHTAAGITASIAKFSTTVATAGKSFVLTTTSAGSSEGGAGDDTWTALDNALTNYSVDGKAGTDTLTATLSGTADSFDVSNVENLTFKVASTSTVDMKDFTGESTVTVSGSSNTTLNNNAAGVTYTSELTGTGALTIALQDATGSTDSVSLTIDGATSTGLATIDSVETINVTTKTDSDSVSLDGNAVTTINIDGAGDGTFVLPVGTKITTISAAAATGDLTIALPANDLTFTGGSGDDAITMSASSLDEDDTVDGGAGADTLTLTASTNAFATVSDTTTETLAVSNVETLALTAGAASDAIDFDLFATPADFTKVAITSTLDAATLTLTDIQTDHVTLRNTDDTDTADTIAALTYDKKDSTGTADALTLDITNRDVTENYTITTLTAAGIETLTFNTVGGTDGDITITTLTAAAAETINITGDADLTVSSTLATTVETISAGSTTGDLTLTFGVSNVNVTTGSGADTLNFATTITEADVIDGGAGTDTLTVGAINTIGTTLDLDLQVSNIERFTFTEVETSEANITFDFNGDYISRFTIGADHSSDDVLSFEDLGSGNIDIYYDGESGAADGDTTAFDRSSDTATDSADLFLTYGSVGTITLNDEETITVDTTASANEQACTVVDLDASDATSVTFTNDDAWDDADIFSLTLNSIKSGATIDFSNYQQSIGNAAVNVDIAGTDTQASTVGIHTFAECATTTGFLAVATGKYTIKLGDNRTNTDHETVINLGASNTGADTIQFVNGATDTTNNLGVVLIDNFNDAEGHIVNNRSLLDLSAFGIESTSDLTITAAEGEVTTDHGGGDISIITATDSDDFAGSITILGVTSTDWENGDFVFA